MKTLLATLFALLLLPLCAVNAQMVPGAGGMTPNGAVSVPLIVRSVSGPTINCIGDSECNWGTSEVPPGSTFPNGTQYQSGTLATSWLSFIQAFSNNSLYIDTTQGYPGAWQALTRVTVLTPGSGCTPSTALTFTPSAPAGSPANQASAVQFTTTAAGALIVGQSATLSGASAGSGYLTLPTYTISGGSCSVAPTFAGVITGTFTYGINGDLTAGTLQRVPDICANPPDWAVVQVGTNDLVAAVSEATIVSNLQAIVSGLQSCNIRIVLAGINARTIGSGGWTQTMDRQRLRINRFLSQLSIQSRSSGLLPQILFVDNDHFWVDPTASGASAGNSITAMNFDGLHPSVQGAEYQAIATLAVLQPYLKGPQYQPDSQNDLYDGTNNPTGNLLGTAGLMIGTGGTAGSNAGGTGTCAGTIATGWTFNYSGTGTLTCTSSIESSRTDGLPGQRQVITYSNATGGTSERLQFSNFTNFFSNLTAGTDKIYMTAEIDVSNLANIESLGCVLTETAPTVQTSIELDGGNIGASFNLITNTALAKLSEAKFLPDFGLTGSGSYRLTCRTAPITVQSGVTGYGTAISLRGTASGVTETATIKVGNVAIRKVVP